MAKYHVTDEGPKTCNAKIKCPLQSEAEKRGENVAHFDNKKEATAFYEEKLRKEFEQNSSSASKKQLKLTEAKKKEYLNNILNKPLYNNHGAPEYNVGLQETMDKDPALKKEVETEFKKATGKDWNPDDFNVIMKEDFSGGSNFVEVLDFQYYEGGIDPYYTERQELDDDLATGKISGKQFNENLGKLVKKTWDSEDPEDSYSSKRFFHKGKLFGEDVLYQHVAAYGEE